MLLFVAAAKAHPLRCRAMALTQSASLMALGLKGERSMARRINSVPSLGSNVDFNYGRPNYAVSACVLNGYCCCRSCCFSVSSTTTCMIPQEGLSVTTYGHWSLPMGCARSDGYPFLDGCLRRIKYYSTVGRRRDHMPVQYQVYTSMTDGHTPYTKLYTTDGTCAAFADLE